VSALADILHWSAQRPPWQRDALRRLVIEGQLHEEDIEELVHLCRAEHGLSDEEDQPPVPQPLAQDDLPGRPSAQGTVELIGIRDPEGVNALAQQQKLSFSADGMTIVFGYNGTGKTGYARILKSVCRARARGRRVLGNVFSRAQTQVPCATVDYRVAGSTKTLHWKDGQPAPPELSNVSFFDSDCAAVHVAEANQLAYTPMGLDLLPRLVAVCQRVQERLETHRDAERRLKPQSLCEPQAAQGTNVRDLLDHLGSRANLQNLRKLSTLKPQETKRIDDLQKTLAADPVEMANVLRQRRRRIERIHQGVSQIEKLLDSGSEQALKEASEDAAAKDEAVNLAAQAAFQNEPLRHVGSDAWRHLWEAARRYSQSDAYPAAPFPVTKDARCVLCQQPLGVDAAARLERFEQFVKDDTQRVAEEARRDLDQRIGVVRDVSTGTRVFRDELADLALCDKPVHEHCRRYLVFARLRRRALLRATRSDAWSDIPDLVSAPADGLAETLSQLDLQARELDGAAKSDERKRLTKELSELEARRWVATVLEDVEKEFKRLRTLSALEKGIGSCATTGITRMSSELTQKYVSSVLRSRFIGEVDELGAKDVRVRLSPAGGRYGAPRFQITLQGAEEAVVRDVVSEGEFSCIALAGFLAELATADESSTIILDDPVCSLDHRWRRRVAERLVREAKQRQVIVFTHDVPFLFELVELCEKTDVPLGQCYVDRYAEGTGVCLDGAPWIAMNVGQRLSFLKNSLQEAAAIKRRRGDPEYTPAARRIYGLLRETWEQAVQDVLLYRVVVRFGRDVQTQRLSHLTDISDDDVRAVKHGMTKCSRFLEGHDEPGASNDPIPDPDEIRGDLELLETWIKSLRKRGRN
jgi:ABC-type transport system involved in cytochrome c biogenesis ATPase subunit